MALSQKVGYVFVTVFCFYFALLVAHAQQLTGRLKWCISNWCLATTCDALLKKNANFADELKSSSAENELYQIFLFLKSSEKIL
jgi:hypothetical protein